MRIYERFWSNEEIRGNGELVRALRREVTVFRFESGAVDAVAHGGVLSLKGVTSGRVKYGFGARTFETAADRIVLTPEDASYSTRVSKPGAAILSLYFPAAMAAQAHERAIHGDAALLDDPDPMTRLAFPPHMRSIPSGMRARLASLNQAQSSAQLQSVGFEVMEAFTAAALEASRQWRRAPAAKPSVRAELFRRAAAARDCIEDNLHRVVPLDELARVGCLSPFHLHRVFASVFGETPFEMSRRRRLETAKVLLAAGRPSIEGVAAAVGFENGPAFSRAFRSVCGVSPSQYRRTAAG